MSSERTRSLIALIAFPVVLVLICVSVVGSVVLSLPDVRELKGCMTTSMNKVDLCPTGDNYVTIDNISEHVIDAIIVSEDSSFFDHDGFDWFEIRESFTTNIKRLRLARGGSTITQQLAKNVFLAPNKNIIRKVREAFLTKEIEGIFSKNEILERYLNVVEFGPNIYGIKQASEYYFKKQPSALNILESAYIAFLLPNPKLHHVYFEQGSLTDYARQRILGICLRLYRFKKIQRNDLEIANFRVLEFPWADLSWTRSELMDAVDELLVEETGLQDSTLPVIQEDFPDSDPDLPTNARSGNNSDSPWDKIEDPTTDEPTAQEENDSPVDSDSTTATPESESEEEEEENEDEEEEKSKPDENVEVEVEVEVENEAAAEEPTQ